MADKYCDHGAYTSAVVTGTISGSTLTLSAIASGVPSAGMHLIGTSILPGTYITADGSGGTGTYSLSRSHSGTPTVTELRCGRPRATPEWGVAQEGDGTATGLATPAIATITMSGATADAGDTLTILGAVLTCVASGASTNQFNAGTGTTLIDNIVTAINRTTNTATLTAQATGWTTPKIQDALFARRTGNDLEIMTRAGSATYNSGTVAQSGMTGVTGPWSFSGGAGGAWGHLENGNASLTFWPSGIAVATYGVFAVTKPLAGVIAAGDTVNIRAKRSLTWFGYGLNHELRSSGTEALPVKFLVDNGTVWADTNPQLVLDMHLAVNSGNGTFALCNISALTECHELVGQTNANGTKSLVISNTETASGGNLLILMLGGTRLSGFLLNSPGGQAVQFRSGSANAGQYRAVAEEGKAECVLSSHSFISHADGIDVNWAFHGIEFSNSGAVTANTAGVVLLGAAGSRSNIELVGCKMTGYVAGSKLVNITGLPENPSHLSFDACDLGNVSQRGPFYATRSAFLRAAERKQCITTVSRSGDRDFSMDSAFGFYEWNSQLSFPVCRALLDDGTTKWSIKALPTTNTGSISRTNSLKLPRLSTINSLADGVRTLTLEFVAESTLTPTTKTVSMLIQYVDTSGNVVTANTYGHPGAAISSSSIAWSNESGGFVTYSNVGTVNHNKWKLTFTVPSAIETGTEIGVWINLAAYSADDTKTYFFDPEIGVA